MILLDTSSLWDIPIGKWETIVGVAGAIAGIVGQLRGWIANRRLHRFLDGHFGLVGHHLTLIEKLERAELAVLNGAPPEPSGPPPERPSEG